MSIKQGGNTIAGLQDISGKANVDMDNISSTGNEYMANQSLPSDRVVALTLGASGATYTAPADGYAVFTGMATAAGQFVYIGSSTFNNVGFQSSAVGNGEYIVFTIPVSKGQVFLINYNLGSNNSLRFIYANGAQ